MRIPNNMPYYCFFLESRMDQIAVTHLCCCVLYVFSKQGPLLHGIAIRSFHWTCFALDPPPSLGASRLSGTRRWEKLMQIHLKVASQRCSTTGPAMLLAATGSSNTSPLGTTAPPTAKVPVACVNTGHVCPAVITHFPGDALSAAYSCGSCTISTAPIPLGQSQSARCRRRQTLFRSQRSP
jgi:hypothetical protein